jgi:hypothetical protein
MQQNEPNFVEIPANTDNNSDKSKTIYYRPEGYPKNLLRQYLLFLVLPSTLLLLLLPILLKGLIFFVVAAVILPMLALIVFVTYKNALANALTVSSNGLLYHEGATQYSSNWENAEVLRERRFGFTKVRGVQLRERAYIQTESWYEKMELIGKVLAVLAMTPSGSSSQGSPSTEGGSFLPIGLFAPDDTNYQSQLWQQIHQNAPWLFDEAARAAYLAKRGTATQEWDQKMQEMLAKHRHEG